MCWAADEAQQAPVFPGVAKESQPEQDLMSMNLEDLTRVKVFTASRHLEDARTAPSAVSIITADDIRRYGWRTLADALRSLRGFYTANDRLYTYLGIRGYLRPGDYNSRFLLQLNGHRVNENVYGSSLFDDQIPVDLDLVDHIEVVRGPGSSLYGTNAVFGVINVVTRRAADGATVEAAGGASSYFGRLGRLTASGRTGTHSGLLSASIDRSAGHAKLFFPEFEGMAPSNGVAENMDGGRVESAFGDLQSGSFRLQGAFIDRLKKYPTGSYGAVFNSPDDWFEDMRAYVDASVHHAFRHQTEFDARVYYDEYNGVVSGDFESAENTPLLHVLSKARADWVGLETNVAHTIGQQRISIGANYEHSLRIAQWGLSPGQPDFFHTEQSPCLTAVFGEAELKLIPKLVVHAGGRADWFSTFGRTLSPRLAIIYAPDTKTAVKYIFGHAFRAPNSYEEFYADNVTIAPAPKKLIPEQIVSNEVVVERTLKPWLTATGDAYYNKLNKLIDQVPDGMAGLSYFVNQGRVHAEGLEFELDAKRDGGMSARASYSLSMAENDLIGEPLANSPQSMAKLDGTMPVSRAGFAAIELLYESALTDYRGTRVPPYFLPGLTYSSKPIGNAWTVSASLYDPLNRRWHSPMGPNDPEDQIVQDGRTFRIKVAYRLPLHEVRGNR